MVNGEILMLGDINIDTVWPLSEFPVPGRDGLTKSLKVEIGGAVFNSAIALDNMGLRTGLLGCVGKDIWARLITEKLSQTNINQAYLQERTDSITGITFIIVTPDGERTMFSNRGANIQLEERDIDEDVIKNARLLHISGYALIEPPQNMAVWRAVELAKKHGVPISLDTGLDPVIRNPEGLLRMLREIDICITGPQETNILFNCSTIEEGAAKLLSLGIQLAAIKLGEKGSYIASEKEAYQCAPFKVNTVDTTGAGDSFTAGLIYGWTNELSLPAAGVLASALGALASTVYGAGFSLPDKKSILDFLESARIDSGTGMRNQIEEVISLLTKN